MDYKYMKTAMHHSFMFAVYMNGNFTITKYIQPQFCQTVTLDSINPVFYFWKFGKLICLHLDAADAS